MCMYFKQPLVASPWLYREALYSYARCNQYLCTQGEKSEDSLKKWYSLGVSSYLGTRDHFLPQHMLPLKLGPYV